MEMSPPPVDEYVATTLGTPAVARDALAVRSRSLGNSAALDQWRGLALVLVLISHGFYFTGRVHGVGRIGVNLFFFISGILVFRSLAKPGVATPWARGRQFLKRRLLRLYPALATYVLAIMPVVFLLQHRLGLPPESDWSHFFAHIPFAFAYLMNYVLGPSSIGHLWSVSCEMQFYLLAPLIFFLATYSRHRNLIWGTLLLILMAAGLWQPLFGQESSKYHFEFAVWPMMLGFFCEYHKTWIEEVSRRYASILARVSLALVAASLVLMLFGGSLKKLVIASGVFVFVPCFLRYLSGQSIPGIAGRGLGWIGERTYSIYLWQQPLTICGYLPTLLHPAGALLSIFVGGLWFHFLEQPFLSSNRKQWLSGRPVVP